ncbi:6-aminohexanoate hydrolase [Streptomyces sp. SID12501]|uniref:6-aminohexanoate hydrolase n=1 Tax=Streptomyces sp. SID12501 TaxID=2706042 RepID=A0A6B3C096_9ACTN|nr:P1 family peptidase [Streptomyces sp. SID12501]NEC89954.1 6-aminohexanoate hydrolase [Streptomyces sp. SID12501]
MTVTDRAGNPARAIPAQSFGPATTNDDFDLTPQPSPGRDTVEFDFPGVEVGTAEYAEGPTGTTVVHVPAGARMFIDERGGAIGLSYGDKQFAHAICLSGGSLYGLGACAGVADELRARVDNRVGWNDLKCVSGAIIYDFATRDNAVVPDAALGRAALRTAVPGRFPVGRAGAGISASVGKIDWTRCEFSGQGAAFRQIGDIKILAATVVNAVGVIVDRDGTVVRGNHDPATGTRRLPHLDYEAAFAGDGPITMQGNTTISVLVTNVRLDDRALEQFGRQVHGSMHRGIQPFHTSLDGDTLFTLTTDEVDLPTTPSRIGAHALNSVGLGSIAGEVMWDAILSSAR